MDIKDKISILKHFDTLDEVMEILKKQKESTPIDEDNFDYITVVSVESLDPNCPYVAQLNICVDEYEDTFRMNILLIEDELLANVLGDAGEDEIDPLESIDRCVEACIEKLEDYFEICYEGKEL